MKLLHLILALDFLSLGTAAKAAPKGKCVACVTAEQRARVQKKLDDLRARVAELEAENEALRNRPATPARSVAIVEPKEVHTVTKTEMKANIISLLGGMGPDSSLTNRRKSNEGGTEIGYSYGPIVGAQYQHVFSDTVAAGLQVTIPTYPDKKYPTVLIPLGYAF